MSLGELYTNAYLVVLGLVGLAALLRPAASIFAMCMAADFIATMILQDRVAFHLMMLVDATLFSVMGILCICDPRRETLVSTGLIGLSVLAHVAYFSLGDARFEIRYMRNVHMFVEQGLFLLAMAALAVGDDNVFQRLSRSLDRWSHNRRSGRNHAAGPVWIRSGAPSPLPEETT